MVLVLIAIWVVLDVLTHGLFLTPRNLYNLSIQTSVGAILACGMVFVIVARQIDLSIGSLIAFTGVLTAFAQVNWFEGHPTASWVLSIAIGLAAGIAVGMFQGWWIAYRGIPALVVTPLTTDRKPQKTSPRVGPSSSIFQNPVGDPDWPFCITFP